MQKVAAIIPGSKLEVRAVVRGAWHAGKLLGVLGRPADASLPFARDGPE